MKRLATLAAATLLALGAIGGAQAKRDDIDVSRLTNTLNQLASDPVLGNYAQAEQALARNAIGQLAQAGSSDRPHALYMAERRVDLAKATAQLRDAQTKLAQLDREHDQIQLDNTRQEAETARRELERQRLQYQMAQEEAQRLQQQGEAYSQAAQQAQAEASKAKRLAEAQSRVARAAKHQAELAAKAAKAMRAQIEQGDGGKP
ncbi:MAG: hypothetical protein EPN56_04740 [Rhodanobacter sp.]|nr:MAG: hypothetical protein EPN78_08125 [Rhodanobacter sp.]TAM10426.1 MAG: hypothetical protein EPN66_09820 [Rhodanobacter sp.]TAM36290.1 MAG: hypothetical protein EPN56_04740 [Rhodanobacter sp.]